MKEQLAGALKSLGSEEALLKILLEFYKTMADDILVGFFFDNKDLATIAENQKDFMLRSAGLKPSYTGKLPASAHLALPPILKGHFDRRLVILKEILLKNKVQDQHIENWLKFENQFRSVIQA